MADVGRWEQVEITWIDKTNCPEAIASMFCPVCGRNLNDIKITVFADGAAAANALRKRKEKTNE